MLKTILLCCLLSAPAAAASLDENTIFMGDVTGPYNNLRLTRQLQSSGTVINNYTTVVESDNPAGDVDPDYWVGVNTRYSGIASAPEVTDNGDGTITIGPGTYNLYASSETSGRVYPADLPGGTFTIDTASTTYIVVSYSDGSPYMWQTTDVNSINLRADIVVLTAVRMDGDIAHIDWTVYANALPEKLMERSVRTERFSRELSGGLVLSETATPVERTVLVTGARVWVGASRLTLDAFSSASDTMYWYKHVAGSWTYSLETQYPNAYYDDGTSTQPATGNKYVNVYVFRTVQSNDSSAILVLGTNEYTTLAEAQKEAVPANLPPQATALGYLVGRITVRNGASSGLVQTVFSTAFVGGNVIRHNDTTEIQGGSAEDYFHLLKAQYDRLLYSTDTAGGDVSGEFSNLQVVDDSHAHTQATLSGVRLSTAAITSADVDASVLIATSAAGGDLTGTLSNAQVVDDSHNHHANSMYDVFLATQSVWDLPSSSNTITHNPGVLEPVNITDASGSTISVSSTTVIIRDNSTFSGRTYYRYIAPVAALPVSDNSINFLYVTWNGGSPTFGATTDRNIINNSDVIPVARVYMSGGNIEYSLLNGNVGWDLSVQGYDRVMRIRGQKGFEKESGLVLTCSTTSPNISAGSLFFGYRRMSLQEYSVAASDNMWIYTHSGGNWIETKTNAINNEYYDNGTSTVALTANRYAINYVFEKVSETDKELDMVAGTGNYTLAQAEAVVGTIPNIPAPFTYFYYPIGAIIIQKGATVPARVVTYNPASGVTFAGVMSHGDLLDLGADDHTGYLLLAGRGGQTIDDNIHVNGSLISSDTVRAPEFCLGLVTPDCITAWPTTGGGGGNTYTTGGVAGQLAYYSDTSTITASGIQPSQVLTSTNTTVARTNADNTFSKTIDSVYLNRFDNPSTGSSAFSQIGMRSGATSNLELSQWGEAHTTYPGQTTFGANGTGGLRLYAGHASGRINLYTRGAPVPANLRMSIEPDGAVTYTSSVTITHASGLTTTGISSEGNITSNNGSISATYGNISANNGQLSSKTMQTTSTSTFASAAGTGMSVGANTAPTMKLDLWCGAECYGLPDGTSGTKGFLRFRAAGGYSSIGMDFGVNGSAPYNGWLQARDIGTGYVGLLLNPLGGNVGIGTSTPYNKLHISSGTVMVDGTSAALKVLGTGHFGNSVNPLQWLPALGDNALMLKSSTDQGTGTGASLALGGRYRAGGTDLIAWGSIAGLKENSTDNNGDGYLAFYTSKDSVGGQTERMSIRSNGDVRIQVSNYNGNAFTVPLDIAMFEMSCRALRATGTDTSVAIKTSGTTSCSAACTGTTTWPNCDSAAEFQDPGGAIGRVRMQNVACATSDSYIKYCCCH